MTRTCPVKSSYIPGQVSQIGLCDAGSVVLLWRLQFFSEAPLGVDGEDTAVLCAPLGNAQRLNFSLDPGLELSEEQKL